MGRRLTSPAVVGRASEMAVLDALLAESASGARFVAISGEAGIGKTRLLDALVAVAAERAIPAFVGGCPVAVAGQPIPFAAVTQALRSIVRSLDARDLDRTLGSARTELARLLPELGGPDDDTRPTGPRELGRLFEAVLLLVERVAAPHGALLVLEDLHWADPSTWALVGHLHRNLGATPILVAVSYRADDAWADPAMEAIGELARDADAERIQLQPLTDLDARALLQGLPGVRLSPPDLATIVRRSAGVPFYLEELADRAVASAADVLPISLRAAVELRSSRLTPRGRLVVDLVATSDGPVDARLLRAAAGLDPATVTRALEEALAARLLIGVGARDGSVDTPHALVREALVAALVPGRQAQLHAMHADAAESHVEWAGTSDVERWRRIANHLLAAGELRRAVPMLLRAGQAARQALAFEDADAAFRQALEIVGRGEPPVAGEAWRDVLADAAAVARLVGASDRAVTLQERAVMSARADTDGRQAMARIRLARYRAEAGQTEQAVVLLREIGVSATLEVRGRCALELARVLLTIHDYPGAVEQADMARRAAHELGDERDAARASAALGVALSMTGHHAEALVALAASREGELGDRDRVGGLARPSRLPDSLLRQVDRATILALVGDHEAASRAALDGAATAVRAGVAGSWAAVLAATAGKELLRMGRWDEASEVLCGAIGADPHTAAPARAVQALLAVRRGDLAAADAILPMLGAPELTAAPGSGWAAMRAMAVGEAALARGGLERARTAVLEGLASSEGDPDVLQRAELACLGLRIEADAVLQARSRRDATAVTAGTMSAMAFAAAGHSELAAASTAGQAPWVSALQARLEAEMSRLRDGSDPAAWQAAVRLADRMPDSFVQAYARYRLAEAMLEGREGRVPATLVLQDCVTIAGRLGAAPLLEDAQRLAVRARISLDLAVAREPSGPVTPRQSARALGLSEREVDVLELLSVGLTDREIGARLFITEKTAGHHVSHILTKLTVTRRGEAAAVAHRLGVVGPDA